MLGIPQFGWCDITVFGHTLGVASYLEDVPAIVLDTFIGWFRNRNAGLNGAGIEKDFDAEGHNFGLCSFDGQLYAIDNTLGEPPYVRISEIPETQSFPSQIAALAREAVEDIRKNIDEWKYWNTDAETEEDAARYQEEYLKKCEELDSLIRESG